MAGRQTRSSAARAAALLSSPPATPASREIAQPEQPNSKRPAAAAPPDKPRAVFKPSANPEGSSKKRKRKSGIKKEDDGDELPHGLEKSQGSNGKQLKKTETDDEKPVKKKGGLPRSPKPLSKPKADAIIANATSRASAQTSPAKSSKKKSYGHTPGKSPYPDWGHPTVEECYAVHELLAAVHGVRAAPETIPAPSATFAGCGEVPSILDALIRTYLSAATSGKNSSSSIQGLNRTFPTGKGSPDYNLIRTTDVSVLFKAIQSGGLAKVKSKNIKLILDKVYEENEGHRKASKKRMESGNTKEEKQEDGTISFEKSAELTCADPNVLSLDHMHALSDNEAFNTFLTYPGIGVKTASCVMLFCMKRPSFAVDTHVFRLCKWLGWVPETATRDKTFTHCEVMIPDKLKYGLHQLFIKHGKTCGRCRAITGESSEGWEKGCAIDHLVKRTGARKGGTQMVSKKSKKTKGNKRRGKEEDTEDDEDVQEDLGVESD